MKKTLLSMLFLFICLVYPLQAASTNQMTPTITLNNLTYSPTHKPLILNEMLYVSAEDIASMTYGTLTTTDSSNLLSIGQNKITFTGNSRYIKLGSASNIMKYSTTTIDQVIYFPISFLDVINYPYTYHAESASLTIHSQVPYSTARDTYNDHLLFETKVKKLQDIFDPLTENKESTPLLKSALKNNQYLSFITTQYKADALSQMRKLPLSTLKANVHFRQLDCSSGKVKPSGFIASPFSYSVETNGISIMINDQKSNYNIFWSTYNPNTNSTDIDLNKSLDTMIFRAIYEVYRSQYDLKDDTNLSPIVKTQMASSDSITYEVYLDHSDDQMIYDVTIYKQLTGSTVDYYVDISLPQK